jgi:hypothetical protein
MVNSVKKRPAGRLALEIFPSERTEIARFFGIAKVEPLGQYQVAEAMS